jgi:hypothetical protein
MLYSTSKCTKWVQCVNEKYYLKVSKKQEKSCEYWHYQLNNMQSSTSDVNLNSSIEFQREDFLPVVIVYCSLPMEAIVVQKYPSIWQKAAWLIQRKHVLNHESPGVDGPNINSLFMHPAVEQSQSYLGPSLTGNGLAKLKTIKEIVSVFTGYTITCDTLRIFHTLMACIFINHWLYESNNSWCLTNQQINMLFFSKFVLCAKTKGKISHQLFSRLCMDTHHTNNQV